MTETMTDTRNHPAVQWLVDAYLPSIGGNKTKAANDLGISHKVLSALIAGTYEGNVDRQLAKLDEQRARLSMQAKIAAPVSYVQTELLRRIWAAADAAKAGHLINWVVGQSQIGKTTAALAYKDKFPETTVYVRLTQQPTISSVVRELADAMNLPCNTIDGTMRRLRRELQPRHLIIVDEAHLALDRKQGADALDIVRELYDRTGCAALIMVTDLEGFKVTRGHFAGQLEQLTRRGLWEILPETPNRHDIAAIWTAYGLPEPDDATRRTVYAMVHKTCFGELTKRIRLAQAIATAYGKPLTWDEFNGAIKRIGRRPE